MNKRKMKTLLSVVMLTTLALPSYALADDAQMESTVWGNYEVCNVDGIAVTTPLSLVNEALAVEVDKAFVTVTESDMGPNAQECVDVFSNSIGAEVGPQLDILVGKMQKNGVVLNVEKTAAPIEFTVGLPEDFAMQGYDYAVISVREGGETVLLNDTDLDPNTVSFSTDGFGAFAIVRVASGTLVVDEESEVAVEETVVEEAVVEEIVVEEIVVEEIVEEGTGAMEGIVIIPEESVPNTSDLEMYDEVYDETGYPSYMIDPITGEGFARFHEGEGYYFYYNESWDSKWYDRDTKTFNDM